MDLGRILKLVKDTKNIFGGYYFSDNGFEVWWAGGELKIRSDRIEFTNLEVTKKFEYDPRSLMTTQYGSLAEVFVWIENVLKNPFRFCTDPAPINPRGWLHTFDPDSKLRAELFDGKWKYSLDGVHIARLSSRDIKAPDFHKSFNKAIPLACTFLILDGWVSSGMNVTLEEWFRPWLEEFSGTPKPSFSNMYFIAQKPVTPIKTKALEVREKAVEAAFGNILKQIEDQASKGTFSLTLSSIDSQVADLLRQEGFSVSSSLIEW